MHRLKTPGVLITIVALLMAGACGENSPPTASPTPTPSPGLSTEVVPGEHIGTTEITFLSAEPAPGSTLTGCGSSVSGCSGRVQMRFRFLAASGAPSIPNISNSRIFIAGFTSGKRHAHARPLQRSQINTHGASSARGQKELEPWRTKHLAAFFGVAGQEC